jgi:methyltransferase (TIGR00027 family)
MDVYTLHYFLWMRKSCCVMSLGELPILKDGAEQVVSFGAGFDTRAFRIPGVDKIRFYELDLPAPQRYKQRRLEKYYGKVPDHVTFIPIDFDRQDIATEMAGVGFQEGVKTFYIWEGVTQYITAEAVDGTLAFVTGSAPGSQIAFTYIHGGILDGSARTAIDQRIMARVAGRGMPWVFGLKPEKIEGWLGARGFRLVDRADASEYRVRYVTTVGRQLTIYEGEHMALAQVV